jgi:outer membrane protein OmpA-like peptidoglycan-associated protein
MSIPLNLCRISVLAAAVFAAGCASTPRVNSEVALLQSQLRDLRSDQRIAPNAVVELRDAEQAVQVLIDQPRMRPADFDQNLYLAGRLVNIAEAEGLARHATKVGEALDREREVMLVEARTLEADNARRQAERERMRADDAMASSRAARSDAEQARMEAEDARMFAERERMAADRGLRDAEMARNDAAYARGEAADARADADAARQSLNQMQAELADLQARQTERGLVVTVGDVLFEVDRAELRPGALRELDKLVAALRDRTGFDLAIEGHTDSTGTAAHNQDLSQRRAESVRGYLVAQGINRSRTSSIGLGQDSPIASNANANGRQQNRRVEIVIQQADAPRVGAVNR